MRSSTRARPLSADSSDGYSSGSVASVRNPRLPKLTPRIGTSTPAAPTQSATDNSVPSPPSTTSRSTIATSAGLSATLRPSLGGMSAAVAVSNSVTWPRAASHDSISVRCGVASRRCDFATMPTLAMSGTPLIVPRRAPPSP
jgi:hypothetical protein